MNIAQSPIVCLSPAGGEGEVYTGISGTTDDAGQVSFTLPVGSYRFRADYDGVPFWSGSESLLALLVAYPREPRRSSVHREYHCDLPGCTAVSVTIPGGAGSLVIDYGYDPLGRLTSANYSNDTSFTYTYDAVGNRLTQVVGTLTTSYAYDDANRMISLNSSPIIWDANGNLTNDGVSTYAYDVDNRLSSITTGSETTSYAYNGLGDRLSQTIGLETSYYTLDLNAGLTQVLTDGEYTYLYGLSRLGQDATTSEFFLGDALGSVRQLADTSGVVTLTKSYTPFGDVLSESGTGESIYGYTGEVMDESGLVFLRARYYLPGSGRFITRDVWDGEYSLPLSNNKWIYSVNNPIIFSDPSGYKYCLFDTASLCVSNKQELLEALGQTVPIHLAPGDYWVYTSAFVFDGVHSAVTADFIKNFQGEYYYTNKCGISRLIQDRGVYITDLIIDIDDINYLIMVMSHEAGHSWIEYLREHSKNYDTAVYPFDLKLFEEIYINHVLLDSTKIDETNKFYLRKANDRLFSVTGRISIKSAEDILEQWYGEISAFWLLDSIY